MKPFSKYLQTKITHDNNYYCRGFHYSLTDIYYKVIQSIQSKLLSLLAATTSWALATLSNGFSRVPGLLSFPITFDEILV